MTLKDPSAIDLRVVIIESIMSCKYISTFPTSFKGWLSLTYSIPTPVIIVFAVGLSFELSYNYSLSIAWKILDICLLILDGLLPLDKMSNKSDTDTK
jgi:hypothetical protein